MIGPVNGIVGGSYGIDIPESRMDDQSLNEERKLAKYSKTAEYKRLKQYIEAKIAYYQKQLPSGQLVESADQLNVNDWVIANTIIREFQGIIDQYEGAAQVVGAADNV